MTPIQGQSGLNSCQVKTKTNGNSTIGGDCNLGGHPAQETMKSDYKFH